MKKTYLLLGIAPALALAACGGGNETATTNTAENAEMSMPVEANVTGNAADNAMMTEEAATPAQRFANAVGASDFYEIEAGRLAQEKAQAPKFKEFGQMMVEHHSASTEKLKAAGGKATPAITPNPRLNAEQEANLAALRAAEGAAFDTLYKTQQVAAHEKALATVKDYAASGDTASLKAFAAEASPLIQSHLTKARGL